MGFLDKFRGKNKKKNVENEEQASREAEETKPEAAEKAADEAAKEAQPAAMPETPESAAQPAPQEGKIPAVPEEKAIRSLAVRMLPKDIRSEASQHALVAAVCEMLEDSGIRGDFDESITMLWQKGEDFDDAYAVAQLTAGLIERLKHVKLSGEKEKNAAPDVIMRAWAALDYYGHILRAEVTKPLIDMRDELTGVLMDRKILMIRQTTPMEKLVFQCAAKEREKAAPEVIRDLHQKMWEELKNEETLLVAFDEDFNAKYPFLGLDGAACVFMTPEIANAVRTRMADTGDGHFSIHKLEKGQLETFAANLRSVGILAMRIFLQSGMCVIPFRDVMPPMIGKLLDTGNRNIRGMAIRTLQYNARLSKMNASLQGSEKHKQLTAAMLTMRANLCRELGNSLLYVLGPAPYTPGVTLYTPDALERAKKLMEANKLPEEALIAPGDRSLAAYEGKLALRATTVPGQNGMKQTLVCAFTQRNVCEGARKHFENSGSGDSVVAVTWDELQAQAETCAGVLLDMAALSMLVPCQWFADVEKFRQSPNPIIINLKDKNDKGNPPAAKA